MTVFRCCDVESTGIPSETERHSMVEAAYADVVGERGGEVILGPWSSLCHPGRPVPPEASAVHHLRDIDVKDAPSPDVVCAKIGSGGDYYVAHNSDFDRQFFGGGDKPWICTWKCALRIWPDAPSHKLQVLRYWLKFDDDPLFERDLAMPPHRAAADAYCAAFLLLKMLDASTIEQMVKWSSGPALLVKVGFGKHFGLKWSEVPRDYLSWILEKSDITDRDVRATAKFYAKRQHES